jgi:nucleotide-binding universal stress UspA family protein
VWRGVAGVRDLMVHLDNTSEDEVRIAHVETIVATFDAHLTGIYTNLLPDYGMVAAGDAGGAAVAALVEVEERARAKGAEASKRFAERLSRVTGTSEVRRIDASPGEMAGRVAAEARWSDLFVATCPYRDDSVAGWDEVLELVLFESGHSVYFVPPGVKPRSKLNRALIAWTDTPEAARAVAEALPFLRAASDVEVVVVGGGRAEKDTRGYSAMDIAAHLDRHGIKVAIRPVEQGERNVSESLIQQLAARSADLIVMGAYGHSRWREWIIGGTTREMLRASKVPLLMAH